MRGIEKDATNQHGGYGYVSTEGMVSQCRRHLHDAGLAFVQRASVLYAESPRPVLENSYLLIDGETGDALEIVRSIYVVSNARTLEDKAVAAADSFLLSYTLRGLLMIPRVDGLEDVDARDDAKVSDEEVRRVQDIVKSRVQALVLAEQGPMDDAKAYDKAVAKRMHDLAKHNGIALSKSMPISDLNRLAEIALSAIESSKACVESHEESEDE